MISYFLEYYFSDPAAQGKLGAILVLFYLVVFLIAAILRGQIRWTKGADGNFHLSDLAGLVIKAETIPLAFLLLGLLPFFLTAPCIWEKDQYGPSGFGDCSPSDYRNGSCETCADTRVAVHNEQGRVEWLPSLANAYAYGVIRFQVVVLFLLAGAVAFVFFRILWGIGELVFLILSPAGRFVANQLRKIPLRL